AFAYWSMAMRLTEVESRGPLPFAEVDRILTGPGAPFEIVQAEVGGVPMRVWKNAPRSLRTLLEASLAYGERPFLIYEDKRLSYAAHGRRATLLANALMRQFGVAKGDRVAIAMRNYPEWSVAFWAATAVGAVAVPLNAWWTGPEL